MTHDHDHDRYAHWAAAQALGALDADDRRAYETHFATCGICAVELAELAPLPGLIAKIDPSEIEHDPDSARAAAIAATAKDEIAAIQRRSRRWQLTATGLAAAAAVLFAVILMGSNDGTETPPIQAATVASTTATSTNVAVSPRGWGTEITLDIAGLPARDSYQLWAIDTEGAWTSAATWSATPAGVVRLTGATSTPTAELERIIITSGQRDDLLVDATP